MQQDPTDGELIALLESHPERAVEVLFRRYYADLCRSAFRMLPDAGLAEDLVQEVFYELWKRQHRLRITTSLGAYLRRATVNKTLNYIRDHRKVFFESDEEVVLTGALPHAGEALEARELEGYIDRAIDRLPERCRIVFVLSRFEEMTYQEIADELGLSVKTVENQITKALRLLREALGRYLSLGLVLLGGWLGG